jgi:anti-sigma factor RsiW
MICADIRRDLDPYVDRELDPDSAAAVRDHLRTCVDCRQRVAGREALGRLVRAAPYYPAPDRLRARLSTRVNQSVSRRQLFTWAAAAVVAIAVAGSLPLVRYARARAGEPSDAMVEEVVSGHVRSMMADHLFDVRSTDQHTVKPWFLGKLDFSPPVTDLASIGFPLVGGRLDYLGGRPVAALVYQRQKHTINLFIWPARDSTSGAAPMALQSVRGFHTRHWIRDGMSFWAVSDVNDADLSTFAVALQAS